jgi:hypothetical protein
MIVIELSSGDRYLVMVIQNIHEQGNHKNICQPLMRIASLHTLICWIELSTSTSEIMDISLNILSFTSLYKYMEYHIVVRSSNALAT